MLDVCGIVGSVFRWANVRSASQASWTHCIVVMWPSKTQRGRPRRAVVSSRARSDCCVLRLPLCRYFVQSRWDTASLSNLSYVNNNNRSSVYECKLCRLGWGVGCASGSLFNGGWGSPPWRGKLFFLEGEGIGQCNVTYRKNVELHCGCSVAYLQLSDCVCEGVTPITVRPPNMLNLATTLPTVRMVVEVSKSSAVLSTALIIRILRSKVTHTLVDL